MATTTKALARTAASTSAGTTLYTQPNTSTITIVTNVVVCNTTTSAATATVTLGGVDLLNAASIAANSTAFFDIKQVIPASNPAKTITGSASTTGVNFHISGVEVA